MRRSRRATVLLPMGIFQAKYSFFFILALTAMITLWLLVYHETDISPLRQPPYGLQKTFITVECADGRRLGNVMFSYAALIGLAKRHKMAPLMPDDFRLTDVFRISAVLSPNVYSTLGMYTTYAEYGRRASAYDIKSERLISGNTRLVGYFQSWKYFAYAQKELHEEFQFIPSISTSAKTFLQNNIPDKWRDVRFTRVGIHVRRGDILLDHFQRYGYTTADRDYFQIAMRYFKEKHPRVQFVACSDDIQWTKDNVFDENIVYSTGHSDVEDLAILSSCDHTIISVGSFGWWAAWLSNGTTVYYKNWPREYTQLEYHISKLDYFPSHWIPMK